MVRLLLSFGLLVLAACATSQTSEQPVAPSPPPAPAAHTAPPAPAPARAEEPSQPASILTEPLQPVRGGAVVLPPYKGPEPCKMALLGESPVAKACSEGGQRQAVALMNLFVRRAREAGMIFECTDCHADEDDLTKLRPRAETEFRKLLFLARPQD